MLETYNSATKDREKRLGREPFWKIGHVDQAYILEILKSHAHAQKRPKNKQMFLPLTDLCAQFKQEVETNPEMRNGLAVLKESPSKNQFVYTRKDLRGIFSYFFFLLFFLFFFLVLSHFIYFFFLFFSAA